jgi:hemolysin activation/secretion protein
MSVSCPRRPLAVIVGACLVSSGTAWSQTPPDAGAQFSEQQQLQRRLPDRIPDMGREETVRPALRPSGGERILLKQVRFTGALHLVEEGELRALVADAIGKPHDFAALEALAQRITDALKQRGYLLARAYLPRQDVTDGDIEIAILAGRLDGRNEPVRIVPAGKLALRIDPERLKAIAGSRLKPDAVLREDDLQRALLLMNDLPGVSARSRLEPGGAPDSTRVVVDVEQAPLLALSLTLDNHGNRYTGDVRVVAHAQADDPLGIGDRLALALTHADRSDQLMLGYSLPLGGDGLRIGLSASRLQSRNGKEFASLGLESRSETLGLSLSYPFIRHRLHNLWGRLGIDRRHYLDSQRNVTTNDRRTRPVSLGLGGDLIDTLGGGGFNQAGVTYVSGYLDLDLPVVLQGDAVGAKSAGRYGKWNWNAARLQRLGGEWTLLLAASGQWAGKNLDSSEKFALGGPTGVRAYAGSEALGDEGRVINLELRHETRLGPWGQLTLSGFYDHGRVTLHKDAWAGSVNNATGRNTYALNGFGLGAQLAKPGSHSLRLVLARRIGDNPGRNRQGLDSDGLNDAHRAWLQAMIWF